MKKHASKNSQECSKDDLYNILLPSLRTVLLKRCARRQQLKQQPLGML